MAAIIKRRHLLFANVSAAWRRALLQTPTGSFTPTPTGVLNLDSVTGGLANYARIDDYVIMTGSMQSDATAAGGTDTLFRITLPIASDFVANECRGIAMMSTPNTVVEVFTDTTNNAAQFYWKSTSTALNGMSYVLGYRIV